LVGKHEGKHHVCRWEYNIKMDHKCAGYEDENWTQLPQDRVQWRDTAKTVMNFEVPKQTENLLLSDY
jgi:hypothetical protein